MFLTLRIYKYFAWQDTREQDPKDAAAIDVSYVGAGIMTVNEVRANMGLPPIGVAISGGLAAPDSASAESPRVSNAAVDINNQGGEHSSPPLRSPSEGVVVKNSSGVPRENSGSVKKNLKASLRKDDDSDDEDESDDESDDSESVDTDSSDSDGSDFDSQHPRWPAGSPDSQGGRFAPKGSSATDTAAMTDVSSSVKPTATPPDEGITSDPIGGLLLPAAAAALVVEAGVVEGVAALGSRVAGALGETSTAEEAAAESQAAASETSSIIARANQITGNDGIVASSRSVAEDAANNFVGENARPIYDNSGNPIGKISSDGTNVVRYTSVSKPDPYINLENKTTGGNLHVRWNND